MRTIKRKTLMKKLGNFISVENTPSRNGEREAPNQFQLTFEHGVAFQSYASLVGVRIGTDYYFTDNHIYSVTTSGHCSRWCGFSSAERKKGLNSGIFTKIID